MLLASVVTGSNRKTVWPYLLKLRYISYDLVIPLLDICSIEMCTRVPNDMYENIFRSITCNRAQTRNNLKVRQKQNE
jgi:hypothetical protein